MGLVHQAEESRLPEDLINAYRNARYAFKSVNGSWCDLRLNKPSAALREILVRTVPPSAALVTAFNPEGRLCATDENRLANEQLRDELFCLAYPTLKARGCDPKRQWPSEDSFLIIGIRQKEACDLALKYRQNALLWAGADAVFHLLLLR